ncbi:MAG: HU family DNA-binding protein [Bacteroidales bacterium]
MINYNVVKRNISTGFNPGEKYLAVIDRSGIMTQEQLADRISEMSSLAYNDVLSALAALQMVIADATMNGITVQLDQLGNFTPFIKSTAVDAIEDANVESIKRLRVIFYPNVRFKKKLKSSGFVFKYPVPKGLVDPPVVTP